MNGAEVQNLIERLREETSERGFLHGTYAAELFAEAADALEGYQRMLSEHHSVGGLEGWLVGDVCPICNEAEKR